MGQLWLVRCGKSGEKEMDSIEQDKVFIGWPEADDLSKYKSRDEIFSHLKECYPHFKENKTRNHSTQLNAFANRFEKGDLIVMPRKSTNVLAIGKIEGNYSFDPADESFKHSRPVKWLKKSVPRSSFKQDLLYSFGAIMTVCQISRNNALNRILHVLEEGMDLGPLLGEQGTVTPQEDETDEANAPRDIQEIANQQIISLIKSEFAGHALAHLIAEILQIEGYTTKVSPPGPDGGVDILAAGGTLGLGEERICVQVKSGDGDADQGVVLKLIGSVSDNNAQTGLLVSLGGVNVVAKRKLDENFFKIRLWQMPELLKALFRNYDKLSDETRGKLQLKQIWIPVSSEDA